MRWNSGIRQTHRWVSLAFMLAVVANIVGFAVGQGQPPPDWVVYSPLPPLVLLMLSGLYLFALPYAVRWRSGRSATTPQGKIRRDGVTPIATVSMTTAPEDSNVDVLGEARQLLDAWCERRSYDELCTMWGGLRSINGLTDGWEAFAQSLKQLRVLATNENSTITQAEAEMVQRLIGVVGRALNAR